MSNSQVYVWDLTLSFDKNPNKDHIENVFKEFCKKYCFQKEQGSESGYIHFQCRFSLKKKDRKTGVKKLLSFNKLIFHDDALSPTSSENKNNSFYAMKEDTRLEGPWCDNTYSNLEENKQKSKTILKQIALMKELRPFQKEILKEKEFCPRTVNCIIDIEGCRGKSALCAYMEENMLGVEIVNISEAKDIARMSYDLQEWWNNERNSNHRNDPIPRFIIDLPRAIKKDRQASLFGAIEMLKNGYLYDDRYHFKKFRINCPEIWIFTNNIPDTNYFSKDRWVFWRIDQNYELVFMDRKSSEFKALKDFILQKLKKRLNKRRKIFTNNDTKWEETWIDE